MVIIRSVVTDIVCVVAALSAIDTFYHHRELFLPFVRILTASGSIGISSCSSLRNVKYCIAIVDRGVYGESTRFLLIVVPRRFAVRC